MAPAVAPRLITDLIGTHPGDALIVAGGPSAPEQLKALRGLGFAPDVVLSANEHGHQQAIYPITYAVAFDDRHGETRQRMDGLLRPHGAPLISPMAWADYRLPEWQLGANCGLASIVVALLLGARRVVVTGVDCFRIRDPSAATYFHAPRAASNSNRKVERNFRKQIQDVERRVEGALAIRPVSGYLTEHWPRFDPNERVPAQRPNPYVAYVAGLETLVVEAHPRGFPLKCGQVPGRARLACSRNEATRWVANRSVRVLEPADDPLTRTAVREPEPI